MLDGWYSRGYERWSLSEWGFYTINHHKVWDRCQLDIYAQNVIDYSYFYNQNQVFKCQHIINIHKQIANFEYTRCMITTWNSYGLCGSQQNNLII